MSRFLHHPLTVNFSFIHQKCNKRRVKMFKPKGMVFLTLVFTTLLLSCSRPESDQPLLTAEVPLHLEEHLDAARVEGSEVPQDIPAAVEWRFDEPQPDWKPAKPITAQWGAVEPVRADDVLRLPLTSENRGLFSYLIGMIYVELPDWKLEDWAYVEIRARTRDSMRELQLLFNYTEEDPLAGVLPFYALGDEAPLIIDGTVQTYRLSLGSLPFGLPKTRKWEGPWTHLGIIFHSQPDEEAATLDILSVRVIPREAEFAADRSGVRMVGRNTAHRRTLYIHAPGRLEYKVRVPKAGRLDVGLGVLKEDSPVTFRIFASQKDDEAVALFEETYTNQKEWGQRSVDLSSIAGKTVRIALEADTERSGTVALWAAPTLTGKRSTKKPNIIFYIIDGAGADLMSAYGYNRRTTPNLERLAAEGALFENAYSNCTWTKVSNPSFMTSLYHSVLGGYKSKSDPLPDQAVTMAQHLHRAGYQTAVFTTNGFAGTLTSFDRGVDALRDAGVEQNSKSSKELHENFWSWRSAYSNEPYWVHFQTTDVHGWRWKPVAPFAGLFISPEQRQSFYEWQSQMEAAGDIGGYPYSDVWKKTGISRVAFSYARRGLYDETMAHNDYQIGQLVKRLKAAGEWDHTLLIVASDHGHEQAGCMPLDPLPPKWGSPLFASFRSRIPMIFIWPERIAPGQRLSQPVSMIDMLPTILDLADLPMPEVMQGQSLAPLLLGEEGWEQQPVILDEFYVDIETGKLSGQIEVVDGQWGASLRIGSGPMEGEVPPEEPRPTPLLLYDIWNDPYCLVHLNDKYPDLVEKYTKFLEAQWEAHQALAQHFTRSKDSTLTPEQLETLRSLGYIR
jgi:arylsulfatase A-like enzyme